MGPGNRLIAAGADLAREVAPDRVADPIRSKGGYFITS